jgi:hypothetical protein
MSSSTEPVNLIWDVTFGAVFKAKVDGKRALQLSLRTHDGKWDATDQIDDPDDAYKNLAVDQIAFVGVRARDHARRLRDMFTVTLDEGGDSTSVARAVKANVFSKIVEKVFQEQMKKLGPICYASGEPTILDRTMLTGYYDPADFDTLRKAYAHETREAMAGSTMPKEEADVHAEKFIAAFNTFLDKFDEAAGDELYWFQHLAPLASRLGYVILRKGKVHATKIEMMS